MADDEQLSQEEIQKRIELMKQNCIFCKIVKKEVSAKVIFEDDLCLAILDINPATTGHILLMPKEHYMMMPMVPDNILGHLGVISNYLCELLKQTFEIEEISVFVANGAAAGQQSQHFMLHLIPRYSGDGINFDLSGQGISENELEDIAKKLKARLEGN